MNSQYNQVPVLNNVQPDQADLSVHPLQPVQPVQRVNNNYRERKSCWGFFGDSVDVLGLRIPNIVLLIVLILVIYLLWENNNHKQVSLVKPNMNTNGMMMRGGAAVSRALETSTFHNSDSFFDHLNL
jgi:hypothetical protein